MKFRILASLFVVAVLLALMFLSSEGPKPPQAAKATTQSSPSTTSRDNAIRNLNIQ